MMPQARARIAAFAQSLQELGWTDGRGIQIAYRYGAGDPERIRKSALELLALSPEVVVAGGAISVAPLQQMSRTVPIVFAEVTDPVGAGFAASLVRPGGNATGFSNFEYGFSAKWLELLKEIAPGITRVAVLRDSTLIASMSQMAAQLLCSHAQTSDRIIAIFTARAHGSYWHKADFPTRSTNVRFGGKADIGQPSLILDL
jgi:putative ABC transport system substrate-binding protein